MRHNYFRPRTKTIDNQIVFNPKIKTYDNADIDVVYKNIDLDNIKLLVLSLAKGSSYTFKYLNAFITNLSSKIPNTYFSFFTNNNSHNNIKYLHSLYMKHKNLQLIEYKNEIININNRINKFAEYRNINFEFSLKKWGNNFDYIIVFDSDLYDNIPIEGITKSLSLDIDWSCISSNCTYYKSKIYYDELALRFKNDSHNIEILHPKFKQYYGINTRWLECIRIFNNWTEVSSGFGCLAMYKYEEILGIYKKYGKLYDLQNYPPFTAEHIALHSKLSNKQLISPLINYYNNVALERIERIK